MGHPTTPDITDIFKTARHSSRESVFQRRSEQLRQAVRHGHGHHQEVHSSRSSRTRRDRSHHTRPAARSRGCFVHSCNTRRIIHTSASGRQRTAPREAGRCSRRSPPPRMAERTSQGWCSRSDLEAMLSCGGYCTDWWGVVYMQDGVSFKYREQARPFQSQQLRTCSKCSTFRYYTVCRPLGGLM